MSTVEYFTNSEELKKLYSAARATITAPFYGNNVEHVKTVSEAYKLAKNSPGTVELTGMPIYMPEKVGLPQVLISYYSMTAPLQAAVQPQEKSSANLTATLHIYYPSSVKRFIIHATD